MRVGGDCPSPFTISSITYEVVVNAADERVETPPLFLLYSVVSCPPPLAPPFVLWSSPQSTYSGTGGVYCICPLSRSGAYTTTLLVMVDRVKVGWHAPPTPGWTDFTIVMECTPESGHLMIYHACKAAINHTFYLSINYRLGQHKNLSIYNSA